MYGPGKYDRWSSNVIFAFLWCGGELKFTLKDKKDVFNFIIDKMPQCLPTQFDGSD